MFLYLFNHIRVFIVITLQPVNNATAVFAKVCIKTTEYEPYIAVIIIEVLALIRDYDDFLESKRDVTISL